VDEARRVLERLDRIETLRQGSAAAADLLAEVRALLVESEAWVRSESHTEGAKEVVDRVKDALERGGRTLVA
jgi:hypothetical protein